MDNITDLKIMAGTMIIESKLSNMAKKQLLIFMKEEKDIHVLKSLILDGKIVGGLDEQSREIIDDRFLAAEAIGDTAMNAINKLKNAAFSIGGMPFVTNTKAGVLAYSDKAAKMAKGAAAGYKGGAKGALTAFNAGDKAGGFARAAQRAKAGAAGYGGGVKGAIAGAGTSAGQIAAVAGGAAAASLALWILYRTVRSKFDSCSKRCGTFKVGRGDCLNKCNLDKTKGEIDILNKRNCNNEKDPEKCNKKKTEAISKLKDKISSYENKLRG